MLAMLDVDQGRPITAAHGSEPSDFLQQMCAYFRKSQVQAHRVELPAKRPIYTCGQSDDNLYAVCSGQVKTLARTADGKDCLLDIYVAGDVIGESCLVRRHRLEAAVTMTPTVLRRIPRVQFFRAVIEQGLQVEVLTYLTVRLMQQWQRITHLVTVDSRRRLAEVLLALGHKVGSDAGDGRLWLRVRITQREFAEMVGTTRSRIGFFLKAFRESGLVDYGPDGLLIIDEPSLREYIANAGA